MTFPSPKTGAPVLRAYQIPRSHADLKARRLFSQTWAEATFGLMGRTPDHVAGFFCGYAAVPEVFAAGGKQYAENAVAFFDAHAATMSTSAGELRDRPAADRPQQAGTSAIRSDALRRRGQGARRWHRAQRRAAACHRRALLSDYIHLSCIHPLQPGDENYANGVVILANALGVKLYPRRPLANVVGDPSTTLLSSRFDETDCFVVLDDVFIPWERVFVYRNLELCRDQWWKTPSHLYGNHQAQTRYAVTKLKFMRSALPSARTR